ncbi:MAG: hypothetical protein ACTSQP_04120 [Promethearchaeota archaeon]
MADESKPTPKPKPVTQVIIKDYPKIIFMYPLFFTSLILWIIQAVIGEPNTPLAYFWVAMFFCNLFVMAFDFSSSKFFVLILSIVVVVLIVIFVVLPNVELPAAQKVEFEMGLPANFYLVVTIILGLILLFVILGTYFDYWKIEINEIIHKHGLFGKQERFPTAGLRYNHDIPDVFEFFVLRAGSITMMLPKGETIHLNTVLNVKKKIEQLDQMLSRIRVETDNLDNK